MRSFRLDDYSDRELVYILDDLSDDEGWTTPHDVALRVGLDAEHERHVAVRLAWMRRYGIVEKSTKGPTKWRLTEAGEEMLRGAVLPPALTNAIRGLRPAQIVSASHTLAGRFRDAPAPHAVMTRREWQREIRARGSR